MANLKKEQLLGSNFHYSRFSFSYFLDAMERLGTRRIELWAASPHFYVDDYDIGSMLALRKELRKRKIEIACFTPEQCIYPINIAANESEVRERSIRYFEKTLECAAVLDAPLVQITAGRGNRDANPDDVYGRSVESILRLTRKAESYGITFVLEATSEYTSHVNTTEQIRRMIDDVGSSSFSGMLDVCQVANANEDMLEDLQLLGDDMRHLHFADGTPLGHFVPGDGKGHLPLEDYMRALDEFGYQHGISLEIYNKIYDFDPVHYSQMCKEYIFEQIDRL